MADHEETRVVAEYDHETEAEAKVMEGTEVAILSGLGIDDPYRPIA
jgi:ssRNA-specific RNase YbeY (16S rRNA maturation enzyme)